jgi:hypothetical protein
MSRINLFYMNCLGPRGDAARAHRGAPRARALAPAPGDATDTHPRQGLARQRRAALR